MMAFLASRKSSVRLLVVAAAVVMVVCPSAAQKFAMLLSRGPIPHAQGQLITVSRGRVTAGDYCNPAWGDCTGDGSPDLLLGSDYGDLVLYQRGPHGIFQPPSIMLENAPSLMQGAKRQAMCPRVCDIDGDGLNDLVFGHGPQLFACWGGERFAVTHRLQANNQRTLFPPEANGIAPEVVDFDGDGDFDIVAGDSVGRVWWVENTSTGRPVFAPAIPFVSAAQTPIKVYSRARPTTGDFDGDGMLDLLVGAGDGSLAFFRGTPSGLAPPVDIDLQLSDSTPVSPILVDIDSDRAIELLVGDGDGFVRTYSVERGKIRMEGYLHGIDVPFDTGQYAAVTSADYDGDGDVDVLAGGADGYVRVAFRNADGYSEPALVTDNQGEPVRAEEATLRCAWPRLIDIDSNGTLDLVVGNARGRIELWSNRGMLHYAGTMKMAGSPIQVSGLAAIDLTDYDGDGDVDLFVGCAPVPGTRISISDSALPQFVFPEGGLMYWENMVPKGGGMPLFQKTVRLLGFIGDGDEAMARTYAGVLGPRVIQPLELRHDKWSFLVGTAHGWYRFVSGNHRSAYPTLTLPGDPDEITRAPVPPIFSMAAVRETQHNGGGYGLLCGTTEYGFVCYYPPDVAAKLLCGD